MKRILPLIASIGVCTIAAASVPARTEFSLQNLHLFEQPSEAQAYVPLHEQCFPERLMYQLNVVPRIQILEQRRDRLRMQRRQENEERRALRTTQQDNE
ncbi:MAG: hypothetical protein WBD20_00545 [Pirellulaceae bacterium]